MINIEKHSIQNIYEIKNEHMIISVSRVPALAIESLRDGILDHLESLEWFIDLDTEEEAGWIATNDRRNDYADVNISFRIFTKCGNWKGKFYTGTIAHRRGEAVKFVGSENDRQELGRRLEAAAKDQLYQQMSG